MSAEYGYLYILSNGSIPNAYKVGCSREDPNLRARQLSASSGIPSPFTVVYSRYVVYPFAVESAIHGALDDYRVHDAREFFAAPLRHIIELVEQYEEIPTHRAVELPDLSFAELFASFPDDGEGRELTNEEREKCRAIEQRSN